MTTNPNSKVVNYYNICIMQVVQNKYVDIISKFKNSSKKYHSIFFLTLSNKFGTSCIMDFKWTRLNLSNQNLNKCTISVIINDNLIYLTSAIY